MWDALLAYAVSIVADQAIESLLELELLNELLREDTTLREFPSLVE